MFCWLLIRPLFLFGLIVTPSSASPDEPPADLPGEPGSRMLHKESCAEAGFAQPPEPAYEVNILQGLSPRLLNDSKASLTADDSGCPVLQVGLLSTLTVPLQDFLTDGFADEFSLLVQLRSPQRDDRGVVTALGFEGRLLLQLRVSDRAVVFKGPQQQHYEVPFFGLSDGNWHHVAVSVSADHLALSVDCTEPRRVDWEYRGMENSTAGRLMVGGVVDDHETPFEGHLRQLTFLMGDPGAARQHCSHHSPRCGEISRPPRSPNAQSSVKETVSSSRKMEDLHENPEGGSSLSSGRNWEHLKTIPDRQRTQTL